MGQPPASARPMRVCSRRSGAGAYHAARPSIRWQAGTSTARTRVASMSTANPAPMPNSCRKLTVAVALAKKVTVAGEVRAQHVADGPAVRGGREHPVVGGAETGVPHRQREEHQDGEHRDRED